MLIKVAHSPDSDDAFMFYALANDKIETAPYTYEHTLKDIETLNRIALERQYYEVTAFSIHAYAYLHQHYALLNSGASMGEGYGPMVVTLAGEEDSVLGDGPVAVPGEMTSAFLMFKMWRDDLETTVVPFDQIVPGLKAGHFKAGLIIHEGQVTWQDDGLKVIHDFGQWWKDLYDLPLPLGGNGIRRDLGAETIETVGKQIRDGIAFSLEHRKDALAYAMQFARDMDPAKADEFVGMYVNQRTLDYGREGREAVKLFLDLAAEKKLIPEKINVEFVG